MSPARKGHPGGKTMSPEELDKINLECDLVAMVSRYACGNSSKIVKDLLDHYTVERKSRL
jgi:hypothetical protein